MLTAGSFLQGFEAARDVEALMERMRQLQESLLQDEGASQEEMESRFELEKSESLLVTPSGTGSQASKFRDRPLLAPSRWEAGAFVLLHLGSHTQLPLSRSSEHGLWGQAWV